MAKKLVEQFTCDLDGTDATGTFQFTLDGRLSEVDLCGKHARQFALALKPFSESSRTASIAKPSKGPSRASKGHSDNDVVREWAKAQGYEIGDRGRIAQTIRNEYLKSH